MKSSIVRGRIPVPVEMEHLVTQGYVSIEEYEGERKGFGRWSPEQRRWEIRISKDALDALDSEAEQLAHVRHVMGHIILNHYNSDCKEEDSRIAGDIAVNWWTDSKMLATLTEKLGGGVDPVEWQKYLGFEGNKYVPFEVLHDILHAMVNEDQESEGDGENEGWGLSDMPDTGEDGMCDGVDAPDDDDLMAQALASLMSIEAGKDEETAKQYGLLAGAESLGVDLVLNNAPKPPWVQRVEDFSRSIVRVEMEDKRAHRRPSPMFKAYGAHVPTARPRWTNVPDTVCLLVDTSGSMIGLLEQVAPAVIYLNRAGLTVRLIAGDTRVTLDEEIKGGQFPTLKGGGGTEITPLFKKAMEYNPRAIVCFTDGYVQMWPDKMNLPMLWVSDYDGVPWGEQVRLHA